MQNTLHGLKEQMSLIPLVQESLIEENGLMINVLISKNKRKSRSNSELIGIHPTNGERNLKGEEKGNFIRKTVFCPVGKNNCKHWVCGEVGHYANECKTVKNNKLNETL